MEVWSELFKCDLSKLTPAKARMINNIILKIEGWKAYSNGTGKLKFGEIYGYQRAFVKENIYKNIIKK